jgi:hypothetical protein
MPWRVERHGSFLDITITAPMSREDEWEALMAAIHENLEPTPSAITLPAEIEGASEMDRKMLGMLWNVLGCFKVPLISGP